MTVHDAHPPIRPYDPLPLRDRVVLVSGGAQGIGRGIAQAVIGAGGIAAIGDLDSGPIDALSLAAWRRWLDVSPGGAFVCSKHALPALRQAGGVIVNRRCWNTRRRCSPGSTAAAAAAT